MDTAVYLTKEYKVDWRLPCEKPEVGKKVMVENLDGSDYILDAITANFDSFGDAVVRWAYV